MSLDCPHRPPCPGCPSAERAFARRPGVVALTEFAERVGVRLEIVPSPRQTEYRVRARLAVRGRARSPKLGIFETGSHRIVDIPNCRVHHPVVNSVARAVKRHARRMSIAPYSDVAGMGTLRYAQVVVERASEKAQLVLVTKGARSEIDSLFEALTGDDVPLHSLFWNGNSTRSNRILGETWQRVMGPEAVEEQIGGARCFFPPGAFGQSNLSVYELILARIAQSCPRGAKVVELYAGVGAIGLSLLDRAEHVVFNEISGASLAGLELGVRALPRDSRERTTIAAGPAAEHSSLVQRDVVLVVDPPRRGLDEAIVIALTERPPRQLVYLSCGLDSFLRDAERLIAAGGSKLTEVVAFEMFPHTDHVETLAVFEQMEPSSL